MPDFCEYLIAPPAPDAIIEQHIDLLGTGGMAVFSADRAYRYELVRVWNTREPACAWVMLNPSTADASVDDPTIARITRRSQAWGYGGLHVLNLFALRATNPRALYTHADPVGPENDRYLFALAGSNVSVIAGWGEHGKFDQRGHQVRVLWDRGLLHALALTKSGEPAHPLYFPYTLLPKPIEILEKENADAQH